MHREVLRGKIVAMMQATKARHGNNLCTHRCAHLSFPARWSFLCQAQMSPVIVVITDVLVHEPFQVALVQNDHMVEQIAPAVADEPLGYAILPRTLEGGTDGPHSDSLGCFDNLGVECSIPVEDQIARRGVVRKSFAELLRHPVARRMFG